MGIMWMALSKVWTRTAANDEQRNIVSHINEIVPKYDNLIIEKQSLIADLEAYKKSLIYEVVTGKRKVVA